MLTPEFEINLYEYLEVLNTVLYVKANSDCFDSIYKARGGIPFDNFATFESSFYKAIVKKTPAMYKGVKKTRTKHFNLSIPALGSDEELEINMDDILLGSITLKQGISSQSKVVSKEELDEKFAKLKAFLTQTPTVANVSKKKQGEVIFLC